MTLEEWSTNRRRLEEKIGFRLHLSDHLMIQGSHRQARVIVAEIVALFNEWDHLEDVFRRSLETGKSGGD